MTQNDNFKYYYGQSLINKDTVSEYESIMDYIVAHGGTGSGIDADMLDGHDIGDFLLLNDQDSYMKPGFYIGYTAMENKVSPGLQFLYSRDIKIEKTYEYILAPDEIGALYQELLGKTESDVTQIMNKAQTNYGDSWQVDHNDRLLEAGLSDLELAFNFLLEYEQTKNAEVNNEIDHLKESLLDEEQYNNISYIINNYLSDYRVYDSNGNLTNNTEKVLDAGAVNGLRFFLVTQQQYDQYPPSIKEDPRYIFIIKDNVPQDYVTPTTISASGFKPLFKSNADGDILVSIDQGATYYDAGDLYQLNPGEDGLIPIYIGNGTLPTILSDPLILNENFFINAAWMREFLGRDPTTTNSLDDIINGQIAGLREDVLRMKERVDELDESYELQANKIQGEELVDSIDKYPSSHSVMHSIEALQIQITELNTKLGQIDTILESVLGTGTDSNA